MKNDDKRNPLLLLVALGMGLFEFAVFALLPIYAALGIHLVVCAGVILGLLTLLKMGDDLRFALLIALFGITCGPYGFGGVVLMLALYQLFKMFASPFEQWYESLFPKLQFTTSQIVFERILAGWDDYRQNREVIPFHDIFQMGTLSQKQAVLDQIAQNFSPLLAPILRRALDDPSNAIRIQAASVAAKIDKDYEDELAYLLFEKQRHPHNELWTLKLAYFLDEFAFTGILDSLREEENRKRAMQYYKEYLNERPDDKKATMSLGRLFHRTRAFDEAILWFEERFHTMHITELVWYFDALYMRGEIDKLQHRATEVYKNYFKRNRSRTEIVPTEIKECIAFWAKKT